MALACSTVHRALKMSRSRPRTGGPSAIHPCFGVNPSDVVQVKGDGSGSGEAGQGRPQGIRLQRGRIPQGGLAEGLGQKYRGVPRGQVVVS